jgi:hypothetical protein
MSTRADRVRRLGWVAGLTCAALSAGLPASAAPNSAPRVVQVSGENPQPECSVGPSDDPAYPATRDWDQEPGLTAGLREPQTLVAAWMQGYSDGITTARSADGGRSWTVSAVPILDCAQTHSTIDPSLATGPGATGDATYLSTVATTPPTGATAPANALPDQELLVLRSLDGGATWGAPVEIDRGTDVTGIDGSNVVADPRRPGRAFVRWARVNRLTFGVDEYVASTADGFASASARHTTKLPDVPPGQVAVGTQLVVRPDGGLLAVSAVAPADQPNLILNRQANPMLAATGPRTAGPTDIYVTASDDGIGWSPQRKIARADDARLAELSVASDGGQGMGIAWMRTTPLGQQPLLLLSADSGATWGAEAAVGPATAGPAFAASNDIVVAPTLVLSQQSAPRVLFYDYRNDAALVRTDPGTPHLADVWTRWREAGQWQEQHVAGPFDRTTGPWEDSSTCNDSGCLARPAQLGDYWGAAPLGHGEVGFAFVTTRPTAASPHNTEVDFARVRDSR